MIFHFSFRKEESKASLIGAFMLAREVSRRRKVQMGPIFGFKNPTAYVPLHRVSQSLGSIRGSGDENGLIVGSLSSRVFETRTAT